MLHTCLIILHFTYGWDVSNNSKVVMVTTYLDLVSGIKLVVVKPFCDTFIVSSIIWSYIK